MKEENRTTREKIQNKSIKVKNSLGIIVCLSCYLLTLLNPLVFGEMLALAVNHKRPGFSSFNRIFLRAESIYTVLYLQPKTLFPHQIATESKKGSFHSASNKREGDLWVTLSFCIAKEISYFSFCFFSSIPSIIPS